MYQRTCTSNKRFSMSHAKNPQRKTSSIDETLNLFFNIHGFKFFKITENLYNC